MVPGPVFSRLTLRGITAIGYPVDEIGAAIAPALADLERWQDPASAEVQHRRLAQLELLCHSWTLEDPELRHHVDLRLVRSHAEAAPIWLRIG
jgi:hypothetical protein